MKKEMNVIRIIKIMAIALIVAMVIYVFYVYPTLPKQIPVHFNAAGVPDKYADKITIWFLPLINVMLYFLIGYTAKKQKFYKIPNSIKNKPKIAITMVYYFMVICMAIMFIITYQAVGIAQGNDPALGVMYPVLSLLVLLVVNFGFVWYSNRKEKW